MESGGHQISLDSQHRDGPSASTSDVAETTGCGDIRFDLKLFSQGINAKQYAVKFAKDIIGCLHPLEINPDPWKKRIDDLAKRNPLKFLSYNPLMLALGLSYNIYEKKHPGGDMKKTYADWKKEAFGKLTARSDLNSRPNGFENVRKHIDDLDLVRYILLWKELPVAAPLSCY